MRFLSMFLKWKVPTELETEVQNKMSSNFEGMRNIMISNSKLFLIQELIAISQHKILAFLTLLLVALCL